MSLAKTIHIATKTTHTSFQWWVADSSFVLIFIKDQEELVLLRAIGIAAKYVTYTSIFLMVPQVKGETIPPPVVTEALYLDETTPLACFELYKLCAIASTSSGNRHSDWVCTDTRDTNPRGSEMNTAAFLDPHLSGYGVSSNSYLGGLSKVYQA